MLMIRPPPATSNPGQAELAAILARLPVNGIKPQSPNPTTLGGLGLSPNLNLNINPAQLAELARVAQKIKSPPTGHHAQLPGPPTHSGFGQYGMGMAPPPPTLPIPTHGQAFPPPPPPQQYGQPVLPPGTSRNYGKVKPLKNPQAGLPGGGSGAFSPPPPSNGNGNGYGASGSGSGSGQWTQQPQQHPDRQNRDRDRDFGSGSNTNTNEERRNGWNNQRERSRSPPRRPPAAAPVDNGWGSRRQVPASAPGPTLESFDMASFNPMDPGAWARLGEAWKGSKGSEPSQMDLMGWMMGGGQGQGMVSGSMGGGGGQGWGGGGGGY